MDDVERLMGLRERLSALRYYGFGDYWSLGPLRAGLELNGYAVPVPRLICRIDREEEPAVVAFGVLVQDKIGDPVFGASIELKLPRR